MFHSGYPPRYRNIPDPEPGTSDGNDDELPEDDLPPGDEEIDEEMVALGREGVEKIAADLESGNVNIYQYLNGALTGLGVGANANGIITSATNFVKELAEDTLLQAFGRSISAVGVAVGGLQTFIAVSGDAELSTGDYLNIISTAIGTAALIPTPFPILNGILGVTSGIIGVASVFFSYNIQPGLYVIETPNNSTIYLYIGNIVTV